MYKGLMFNDPSKPVHVQIFEEMQQPEYGYDKDAIEFAKKEIFENKNLTFTMNLANTLAMLKVGQTIFDVFNSNDKISNEEAKK